jgi:hypothetical protein
MSRVSLPVSRRQRLYSLDLDDVRDVGRNGGTRGAVLEVDHGRIHVRIQHTSHERAAMFVATIPGQSYCPVIAEINDQCRGREGPQLATGPLKYNAESARRKARPLARSTAPRGGAMLGANAKTSPGHSSYPTGSQPLMFRETKAILGKTCVP